MENTSVRFPASIIKALNYLKAEGIIKDRAKLIRIAVAKYLLENYRFPDGLRRELEIYMKSPY